MVVAGASSRKSKELVIPEKVPQVLHKPFPS
jgi:hypothetical protein